jgi:hypothetical protein
MTLGRYVEGLLYLAIALVPVAAAAHVWTRNLMPDWSGPESRLAEIILSVAVVVCVAEILGAVHLFRLAATVPVLACLGIGGWYIGRHPSSARMAEDGPPHDPPGRPPAPRGATLAAVAAIGVVAADWGTRTVDALHHGIDNADSQWYHMPFAARFVQQGTVTPLHYVDSEAATVFFPANSEMVHALGILFLGSDFLSPMINLGWGALALLAAWCIGRPFGVAPVSLTGVAALMATPGLVVTQPGGAYDDIVGLALLLSCAALLVSAVSAGGSSRWAGQALAAAAAGLALGTKFTLIAPAAALTVGVWVLARRGQRWREGGTWLLVLVVTGSFWYLRNLFIVGNPLPNLHIRLAGLSLPYTAVGTPTSTVAHYIFKGNIWHQYLFPGLRLSFGPAWLALLALAAAGLVLAVATGPTSLVRMLGWVGLAIIAGFLVTPQYLAILGAPVFFVDNVRYGDPGVAYGLVLLPIVPMFGKGRHSWWILGPYLGILAATQLDGSIWPINVLSQKFGFPIAGVDSLIGLGFGVAVFGVGILLLGLRRSRPGWRPPGWAAVAISVALLGSGVALHQFYVHNRFTNANPLAVGAWAQTVNGVRIATVGDFGQLQYEFYGRQLTNFVQYVGQPEPDHGFAPVTSCGRWRQLLNQGHYNYVITTTGVLPTRQDVIDQPTTYSAWTRSDPAATLVQHWIQTVRAEHVYIGYFLYRLRGRLDPATCPLAHQ